MRFVLGPEIGELCVDKSTLSRISQEMGPAKYRKISPDNMIWSR